MRKLVVVAFCLLMGLAAVGQKIDTKWHCAKPAENPMLKVGDVPDHTYGLSQGSCEAKSSSSGQKTGTWTEFEDMWKASYELHGHFNVTMDNGDMVYYTYEQSNALTDKKVHNKWKIVSGTGKHKGIKGSGTCSGVMNDDGSSDWQCTGTTMTAASEKAEKKS